MEESAGILRNFDTRDECNPYCRILRGSGTACGQPLSVTPPTTYTVSGGLLQTNASGAEIWLAVHDHGPKIPAFLPDMMTTIAGGCENVGIGAPIFDDYEGPEFGRRGPNTCRTIQITFHPP
jgi:hypothetical protein